MSRTTSTAPSSQQLAQDLLRAGKIKKAAELCAPALKEAPDSDAWLYVSGQLLIKQGNSESAIDVLSKAIAKNRSVAAYHHALGNAFHDTQKLDRAISSYRRAIRLEPDFPEAHNDLGVAYFEKHWLEEAVREFHEAIGQKADHDAAYTNLGAALRQQGKLTEAKKAYQRALRLRLARRLGPLARLLPGVTARPSTPAAHEAAAVFPSAGHSSNKLVTSEHTEAVARDSRLDELQELARTRRLDEAEALAGRILVGSPENDEALHTMGYIYGERGNNALAIEFITRAIVHSPEIAKYHNNLGNAYQRQSLSADAVIRYRRAIDLDANFAIAHYNLGVALLALSIPDEAIESSLRALQLDPALKRSHITIGKALAQQGRTDEAIAALETALIHLPDHVDTLNGLGSIYLEIKESAEKAEQYFSKAVAESPNHAHSHYNLGVLAQARGDYAAAMVKFRHAQRLNPVLVEPNFSESLLLLLLGDFEAGWRRYHWRMHFMNHAGAFPALATPTWDGSSLKGKSILIYGEQGMGDELMFAGCLSEVLSTAERAHLVCEPRLLSLFKRSFPNAEVAAMGPRRSSDWSRTAPTTDFIAAIGDLPRYLRNTASHFPDHNGYIRADAERIRYWQTRLKAMGPGIKLGLSWRGGTNRSWTMRRSLGLDALLPAMSLSNAHFISLQYGDVADEVRGFSARTGTVVHHWPEVINDYDETAALLMALDLTLSVCTSVVHLAGSLGRPVWVMAPFSPEWRYGASGEKMIWYPSARVFRQPSVGKWEPVIDTVRRELANRT